MKLLLNKSIFHDRWYEGAKQIESNYKSVVKCEFNNQMSSAGDWNGYLLQKAGDVFYAIPVFQTNLYPTRGYRTTTGKSKVCTLYTKYVDITVQDVWNIMLCIIENHYPIEILRQMWNFLEDVCIDKDENIDTDFLLWGKGTYRMDIWHWFDELCPVSLVKDIIEYEEEG